MTTKKATAIGKDGAQAASLGAAVTGERYREHDLLVRRYHLAGLVPSEIAVVLNSQGIRVKTWAVTETFVRARLEAMELVAHHSRTVLQQSTGAYRLRPGFRRREN
jgi:hypothetical protein